MEIEFKINLILYYIQITSIPQLVSWIHSGTLCLLDSSQLKSDTIRGCFSNWGLRSAHSSNVSRSWPSGDQQLVSDIQQQCPRMPVLQRRQCHGATSLCPIHVHSQYGRMQYSGKSYKDWLHPMPWPHQRQHFGHRSSISSANLAGHAGNVDWRRVQHQPKPSPFGLLPIDDISGS